MRATVFIVSLFLSAVVKAGSPATPTRPIPPRGVGHETIGSPGAASAPTIPVPRKASKKEAKAACKAEGKSGKELDACVKEKTM